MLGHMGKGRTANKHLMQIIVAAAAKSAHDRILATALYHKVDLSFFHFMCVSHLRRGIDQIEKDEIEEEAIPEEATRPADQTTQPAFGARCCRMTSMISEILKRSARRSSGGASGFPFYFSKKLPRTTRPTGSHEEK